jgi:hypothetical protein
MKKLIVDIYEIKDKTIESVVNDGLEDICITFTDDTRLLIHLLREWDYAEIQIIDEYNKVDDEVLRHLGLQQELELVEKNREAQRRQKEKTDNDSIEEQERMEYERLKKKFGGK